jgi:hypothetical protein
MIRKLKKNKLGSARQSLGGAAAAETLVYAEHGKVMDGGAGWYKSPSKQ